MIGTTISHYRILEKLGEGGMSQSYPRVPTHSGRVEVTLRIPLESAKAEGSGRRSR